MYELKNHTESVVQEALKKYIKEHGLPCECERCQYDIMALALNQLPSRYYVSTKGKILMNCIAQSTPDQAKVMATVVRAAQQIAQFPSHSNS